MYKIAIVGAATLLGKELKDALTESSLAAAEIALFDEEEGLGQLDQPEIPVRGNDEMAQLTASFNRLVVTVVKALRMLD